MPFRLMPILILCPTPAISLGVYVSGACIPQIAEIELAVDFPFVEYVPARHIENSLLRGARLDSDKRGKVKQQKNRSYLRRYFFQWRHRVAYIFLRLYRVISRIKPARINRKNATETTPIAITQN